MSDIMLQFREFVYISMAPLFLLPFSLLFQLVEFIIFF